MRVRVLSRLLVVTLLTLHTKHREPQTLWATVPFLTRTRNCYLLPPRARFENNTGTAVYSPSSTIYDPIKSSKRSFFSIVVFARTRLRRRVQGPATERLGGRQKKPQFVTNDIPRIPTYEHTLKTAKKRTRPKHNAVAAAKGYTRT